MVGANHNYIDIVNEQYNNLYKSFRDFIKSRFKGLRNYDIDDLYHDAFLTVHDNLVKNKIKENTSWKSYILSIGYNKACKKFRNKLIIESIDEASNSQGQTIISSKIKEAVSIIPNNEGSAKDKEKAIEILSEEISFTPEPCCSIIKLFYYDHMPMEHIANIVHFKNADTAKTKKSQCMKVLKNRVKKALRDAGVELF